MRTRRDLLQLAALLLATFFAYGTSGPDIGWLSDDYVEVYGASSPLPDLRAALTQTSGGRWSPYRLLKYPLQGYLGWWLGPAGAHILQFLSHVLCVMLFHGVLRRIDWPRHAALAAAMMFAVMPWFSQSVYWWPAASAVWSTALMLGAALCWISWTESGTPKWLAGYAALALLSLALYELWLFGFLFIASLYWYRSGRRLTFYAAIAAPFAVYGLLYLAAPSSSNTRLGLSLSRIPVTLASIHLRAAHWLADTEWTWNFRNADPGLLALAAAAGGLLFAAIQWTKAEPRGIPLGRSLLLAWAVFLGSRLVYILMGGVSTHTRQNYGASLGLAIAVTALADRIEHRRVAAAAVACAVFVLGWTSAGIGVHFIRTTRAEAQTIEELNRAVGESTGKRIVQVIAAPPAITPGELAYFSEGDGYWLDFALRKRCPLCKAARIESCSGAEPGAEVYRWSGAALSPEPCPSAGP